MRTFTVVMLEVSMGLVGVGPSVEYATENTPLGSSAPKAVARARLSYSKSHSHEAFRI